jgi:two-component system sensor histidine kinase ResE
MNELTSTLLNITRIESGTITLTPKVVHIESVIRQVLPELVLMADAKNIKIKLEQTNIAHNRIKTDPLIVQEVVTNLVNNAIKYTPKNGEVSIMIRPRRTDILIEVHDSGWGIPDISQDQIFSKFFRGHNIVKRETNGTGLGLYLVKGLIDVLGGTIWFKSQESKGTSFYFTLPRSKRSPKALQEIS